ncbi:MAG TPA: hypothetical protein VIW73_11985 [Candidatus Cybelea sp.]
MASTRPERRAPSERHCTTPSSAATARLVLSRSNPHGATITACGSAAAIASHSRRCEFAPGCAKIGAPPASSTSSGIQCPALIGGSVHSSTSVLLSS